MIYEFKGYKPVIHESAFIHSLAVVTGNVIIGKEVYIGPREQPFAATGKKL